MAEGTNGWSEWGKHVLKELQRQEECDADQWKEIRAIQVDIATIKAKAFGWGSLAGLITGIIASLLATMIHHALTK